MYHVTKILRHFWRIQVKTKQEQTLFKRSAAGFNKVLIVWPNFTAARKQNVIFEVEGVVTHKKSKRSGTPKLCWADFIKVSVS